MAISKLILPFNRYSIKLPKCEKSSWNYLKACQLK